MFGVVYCPDFYLQCEQLFRPELRQQPLIITTNDRNGGSRVISSSPEAVAIGFFNGLQGPELAAVFSEHAGRNNIKVCNPNYELYADLSARLLASLDLLAPKVVAVSSDEALLELQSLKTKYDLQAYAYNLRDSLKQWLGISCHIGIAPTKTLAKLACDSAQVHNKYKGVVDLSCPSRADTILSHTPTIAVPGVSQKAAAKLSEINIHTAFELSKAAKNQVGRHCSIVIERIAIELSGLPCKGFRRQIDKVNPIIRQHADAQTLNHVKSALVAQIDQACSELDSLNNNCEIITIALETAALHDEAPVFQNTLSAKLTKPNNSKSGIRKLATQLLESLWREGYLYHSIHLNLEGLSPVTSDQFALFDESVERLTTQDQTEQTCCINIETLLNTKNAMLWQDKRSLLSPSFTTKWADIPRVS